MSSPIPKQLMNGPFVVVATITVAAGKEDRVQELLEAVVASANSDAEPDCLTYRFTRSVDKRTIIMFEEYKDAKAVATHGQQPAYKALGRAIKAEGLVEKMDLQFHEEVGKKRPAHL